MKDIIIIGSGIAGLYSAYCIHKLSPHVSFIILEKNSKKWIGGRTNNESFYGSIIPTGAGVARKNKDKILLSLLNDLEIKYSEFNVEPYYSTEIDNVVNINEVMLELKKISNKNAPFHIFARKILGNKKYDDFVTSAGYRDYENAGAEDVLKHYGMEDNACCWKGIYINWNHLVAALLGIIGTNKIKTSMNVVNITKRQHEGYNIETSTGKKFICNKVIIATTIDSLCQLFPSHHVYAGIKPQNFLRLYGKFSAKSVEIMKEYVNGFIIVPGPLQKIIPMSNDIYMIAYSDGANATYLKDYIENTAENRDLYRDLLTTALGVKAPLKLLAIKGYYWDIGTHYYTPLPNKYKTRKEFIYDAQHPSPGVLVVGEVVSLHQGWVNGALESVHSVLTGKNGLIK